MTSGSNARRHVRISQSDEGGCFQIVEKAAVRAECPCARSDGPGEAFSPVVNDEEQRGRL